MSVIQPILWIIVAISSGVAIFGFIEVHRSYRLLDSRSWDAGIKVLLIGGATATAAAIPLAKRRRK
jgi:hypothetical protein